MGFLNHKSALIVALQVSVTLFGQREKILSLPLKKLQSYKHLCIFIDSKTCLRTWVQSQGKREEDWSFLGVKESLKKLSTPLPPTSQKWYEKLGRLRRRTYLELITVIRTLALHPSQLWYLENTAGQASGKNTNNIILSSNLRYHQL